MNELPLLTKLLYQKNASGLRIFLSTEFKEILRRVNGPFARNAHLSDPGRQIDGTFFLLTQ